MKKRYLRLRGSITSNGLELRDIHQRLNKSKSYVHARMNGDLYFTTDDVSKILSMLGETLESYSFYFAEDQIHVN